RPDVGRQEIEERVQERRLAHEARPRPDHERNAPLDKQPDDGRELGVQGALGDELGNGSRRWRPGRDPAGSGNARLHVCDSAPRGRWPDARRAINGRRGPVAEPIVLTRRYDVAIVGGGAVGSSVAYFLLSDPSFHG